MDLAGYKFLKVISRSSTGILYLAEHLALQRRVVVKVIPGTAIPAQYNHALLLEEGNYLSRLQLANIARVLEVGECSQGLYICSDFVHGKNLLSRSQDLCLLDQVYLIGQILQTLDKLHKRDFGHYNLKPSNIFLSDSGSRVVLTDFWLNYASHWTLQGKPDSRSLQTAYYASPEQLAGRELDIRSDLYSVGALMYQLLAGRLPFRGNTIIDQTLQRANNKVPELPAQKQIFQPLIDVALAIKPDDRFQSGRQMSNTLYAIDDEEIAYISARAGIFDSKLSPRRPKESRGKPQSMSSTCLDSRSLISKPSTVEQARHPNSPHGTSAGASPAWRKYALVAMLLVSAGLYWHQKNPEMAVYLERDLVLGQLNRLYDGVNALVDAASVTEKPASPSVAGEPEDNSVAADNKSKRLADKLRLAADYMAKRQYTIPASGNAFNTYRAILLIDPGNQQALAGLDRIAGYYLGQAKHQRQKGDYRKAIETVRTGLRVKPGHKEFTALLVLLRQQQVSAQSEIAFLLLQADDQVKSNQLLAPADNNAVISYRRVLTIDPNHRGAEIALRTIRDVLIGRVYGHIEVMELDAAEALLTRIEVFFNEEPLVKELAARLVTLRKNQEPRKLSQLGHKRIDQGAATPGATTQQPAF